MIPGMNNITVVLRRPQEMAWEAITKAAALVGRERCAGAGIPEISIPVIYGGEAGPDLGDVARHSGLSEKQVVELHSSVEYMVWSVSSRVSVFLRPAGAAGDAASRRAARTGTGVIRRHRRIANRYLSAGDAGRLAARSTPLALFDPKREEPVLRSGDRVRFVPQKEGYAEIYPRRHVYLGTGWRPGRPAPVGD